MIWGNGFLDGAAMNTRHPHTYVLNVMSDDHPGIVAAVGHALAERGGNIDAVSQTVLEGYFTLIMVVSFPEEIDPGQLTSMVSEQNPGFQVMARKLEGEAAAPQAGERFVVTAFGVDKPGIVLRFSKYLAGKDINITDLYGDRKGEEFVLIGQVEVPSQLDLRLLQADLEEMGKEEGFAVRIQHENIFVATNQLRLTRSER
jgi:predicted amino acid-binding ACT domain protein